ncbi:hypothetical protein RhiirA5_412614 [Rhizophagus irregularis]|uniref:Uncharacterized protein n=2 Tax=Rhizophagus irregularis TaxID=588596 RepID=A0A2I1ED00_9GLOM|nr:hypothetical protein RhiirA5_412614 [Rhizophagus irregularis]PKC72746.1 hypothetical protein RhiirA1_452000 [Rhizophagus irregularis]PKY20013.1 hypothetical protein RhiirB3_433205 [Rhizophagus irregularis]
MKNTLLHYVKAVEKEQKNIPPLTVSFILENPNFVNFRNKLEIYICEQIELVYQNKYNLTYKSSTESGTKILLDNEEAFSKFIKDYQTMILGNKKNEVSEQEVNKNTDLDTPPNHALFSIMHSVKVTRKSFLFDEFIQMYHLSYPLLLPLPLQSTPSPLSYNYSNYNSDISNRSLSLSLTLDHSLFLQISDYNLLRKVAPSIKVFLKDLDKEFGDGKFTCYLSIFEEQEIHVSHLTILSDSEYILISVTVIEHRQILHDEAKEYK